MMEEEDILINKYGQGLLNKEMLLDKFKAFDLEGKNVSLNKIIYLILQSKAKDEDIKPAIVESDLKPTYTPCVILSKGVANNNLLKIISLPESELNKAFILLLSLFKIAYQRRFKEEKGNSEKWWYWDLADERNIQKIKELF